MITVLVILGTAVIVLFGLLFWALSRIADYERRLADQRIQSEQQIKKATEQSLRQSRTGLVGKATEQIAPMLPEFCERFSPNDARFLGSPIDYVIFDGLHRGQVEQVIFLEIKSGARSDLNTNEREVRQAVQEGRVTFEILSFGDQRRRRALRRPPNGRLLDGKSSIDRSSDPDNV
jgi:predicted Holliday junction resolvase-like endonuclease